MGRWLALAEFPALSGCAAIRLGAMNAAGPIADAQRHVYFVLAVVLIFIAGPGAFPDPAHCLALSTVEQAEPLSPQLEFFVVA